MFIGIELGTTHCCIAYKISKTNSVEVIDSPQGGGKSIPSLIFCHENEFQYNLDAKNSIKNKRENCIYDEKRFIGRT
jgi:molecular chaperone DnaK (HSP70)